MTDDMADGLMYRAWSSLLDLYAELRETMPKDLVIAGFIGSLAACATEAELPRGRVLAALETAFDDIGDA